MKNQIINRNDVMLVGKITSNPEIDHKTYKKVFYKMEIAVKRTSDHIDRIKLIIDKDLIDIDKDYIGAIVCINGQFRSFDDRDNKKLLLSVYVRSIEFMDEDSICEYNNQIILDGYICKQPTIRKTPLSGRIISDIILAVDRPFGKSDYIPCICWNRAAEYAYSLKVGTHINITGRIQSREYVKKLSETEEEVRTAYEVSIIKIEADE